MITSTALHLAERLRRRESDVVTLAGRPHGGVLHVVVAASLTPGGLVRKGDRPVCRRATRRLHPVPDQMASLQLVGYHQNGRRLCVSCSRRLAHLARDEGSRAGWAVSIIDRAEVHRQELLTSTIAGGTPFEVVVDDTDVGVIAHGKDVDGVSFWHVHSAGAGVPVDRSLRVGTRERAVAVLAIARERASLPGGMLAEVDGLTRMDRRVLDFAARTYDSNGRRDAAITAELGMTPTKYHQRLNSLVDTPAAERYAPVVVHRRRRLRHHHRRRRRLPAYQIPAISVGSPA